MAMVKTLVWNEPSVDVARTVIDLAGPVGLPVDRTGHRDDARHPIDCESAAIVVV